MKVWKAISILALALGILLPGVQAVAEDNTDPLFETPPIKGQSAFTFLKIGASPRAVAMGGAFAAMPGNIDAIFYNPAALGFMEGGQYTFAYTDWLVNSRIYSGAVCYRLGMNVWGISVISAQPEEVEETTIYRPLGTGTMIQASDLALGLTFARQMTDKVSWGIQLKYIQEDLFVSKTETWQFDLGISAYTGYKSLRLAASARNIGQQVEAEVRPFNPPIYFNFGAAAEVFGDKADPTYLTTSVETLFATDYGQRWHFGGELWMGGILALRGGYQINTDVEEYSFGAGLKHDFGGGQIRVDVAYSDGGRDFDPPLRVSVGGSF